MARWLTREQAIEAATESHIAAIRAADPAALAKAQQDLDRATSLHVVAIESRSSGGTRGRTVLLMDGVDLSNWCTGYTITQDANKSPKLTITLIPDELHFNSENAEVIRRQAVLPEAVPHG